MAPHSSTLAWKIPWTEEPGGLQSMGSLGVGHDWATSLSLFTFMHWGRKWQPTPVFLPGESQEQGSLVGCCLWGHIWSRTRLKQLSSSSNPYFPAGMDWGQEEKGTTEDEMAGWHHWLDGRESGWTPGVGDGQGGLACCDSWGHKESDMTERLNWTLLNPYLVFRVFSMPIVS